MKLSHKITMAVLKLLNKCCEEGIIQGPGLKGEVITIEESFLIKKSTTCQWIRSLFLLTTIFALC